MVDDRARPTMTGDRALAELELLAAAERRWSGFRSGIRQLLAVADPDDERRLQHLDTQRRALGRERRTTPQAGDRSGQEFRQAEADALYGAAARLLCLAASRDRSIGSTATDRSPRGDAPLWRLAACKVAQAAALAAGRPSAGSLPPSPTPADR
jgi:hypothetical protein